MLKTPRGPKSKSAKVCSVVVFSLGGRRLAVRAEEVGGVWPWTDAIPVPSGTAFVNALVRRGDEVLPVFDLAGKLGLRAEGEALLCLIAKRQEGPMAVCIDQTIPILHTIESAAAQSAGSEDPGVAGTCAVEGTEVPIFAFASFGRTSGQPQPAQAVTEVGQRGGEAGSIHAKNLIR